MPDDGAGDCAPENADTCTLRAAVDAANATGGGVTTVEVPAGTYVLTDGPLVVSADDTFIFGAASPVTVAPTHIDGGGDRAFDWGAAAALRINF